MARKKIATFGEYQTLAKKTAKKFDDPEKEIMTWGLGVAGEAGDIAACVKKTIAHHNDQTAGIRENVGDTIWYLAMICNFYGWNMDEVLSENVEKLRARYHGGGFTMEKAKRGGKRVDWGEK